METDESPERQARNLALRCLGRREYSRFELLAYLERKGIPAEEAQAAVDRLAREGLVDDRRYARVLVRYLLLRGKGPIAILNRLRQKGISLELRELRALTEEVGGGGSERESARRVVERRYPNAAHDPGEARRAYQALLRRGFPAEVARSVIFSKD